VSDKLRAEEADWFETPLPPKYRARLRQIARYLQAHWPARNPTRLVIRRIADGHDASALCEKYYGSQQFFVITIDARWQYVGALDTLFHEHAHAAAWGVKEAAHGPAWRGVHGEILTAFEDLDAMKDSESW
jgi:hypothetical protein